MQTSNRIFLFDPPNITFFDCTKIGITRFMAELTISLAVIFLIAYRSHREASGPWLPFLTLKTQCNNQQRQQGVLEKADANAKR